MVTYPAQPKRNRRKLIAAGLGGLIAITLATVSVTSLALFTDQEQIPANTFTAGTIDLTTDVTTALVTYNSPVMAPGDQDTAELVVGNAGNLDLRYSLSSVTTEDVLAGELVLTIKSGVTTCDDANWATDGTQLYQGDLGAVAGVALFGDNTAGDDTGDRALAASANETLCFNVTLPLAATNASQGVTSTATFTFDSEQTRNNP